MRASGNGDIKVCAENLLRTYRGEVPYERVKGIDPRMIDRPTLTAAPEIQEDVRWLLETYEPRADVESVNVKHDGGADGGLIITANLTGEGEVTNG